MITATDIYMYKKCNKTICYVIIVLLGIIVFPVKGFGGKDGTNILLTNDLNKMPYIQEFDCSEKIYVVGNFDKLGDGEHTAEVYWINPSGKRQDYAAHKFLGGGYKQNVWFWLKLHRGTGGMLFSRIDNSAGMEEFIGKWAVRFYVDKKLVDIKTFFVAC